MHQLDMPCHAMQEFVLDAEMDRLSKAVEHASKSKRILQELLHVYDVEAHFMAERSVGRFAVLSQSTREYMNNRGNT